MSKCEYTLKRTIEVMEYVGMRIVTSPRIGTGSLAYVLMFLPSAQSESGMILEFKEVSQVNTGSTCIIRIFAFGSTSLTWHVNNCIHNSRIMVIRS
jgi:hypothetical protein